MRTLRRTGLFKAMAREMNLGFEEAPVNHLIEINSASVDLGFSRVGPVRHAQKFMAPRSTPRFPVLTVRHYLFAGLELFSVRRFANCETERLGQR